MTAPRYVGYGGEQVFQQPYTAHGTTLYAFVLPIPRANRVLPQQFLDRVFNRTSGGAVDFRVAMHFVLLSFQHFAELSAQGSPDQSKGGFPYNEATLWLPVTDKNQPGLNLSHFVPYIFADNHFAIAAGREVYGFPKALGHIAMPQNPDDTLQFSLSTTVIKKFSPQALGEPAVLIEARSGQAPQPPASTWQKLEHAAEHLAEHIATAVADEAMEFAVKDLFQPKVEMVFLKQFRDAASGESACYQAIIQGASAVTDFAGGALLDGLFDIAIHSYDSHPIAADLGLESSYNVPGFRMDFSFDILPGRELWKAPQPASPLASPPAST